MKRNKVFTEYLCTGNEKEAHEYKRVLAWMDKMQELADKHILANLPHGSGIDGTWLSHIEYRKVSRFSYRMHSLVCTNAIHCMDENGYYDNWVLFTLTIPISGNCIVTDKMKLIAHGWKGYTTKKYWPRYKDWLYESIEYSLPRNPLLFSSKDIDTLSKELTNA